MKGSHHPPNDLSLNPSANPSIRDVLAHTALSRRTFLQSTVSAPVLASLGGLTMKGILASVDAAPIPPGNGFAGIGFESIPPNLVPLDDAVAVPPGYQAEILAAWGDPILPNAPPWIEEATQDAAAQAAQFGMHNDGMHFFPFPDPSSGNPGPSSEHGLLCVNHEYTQEEILHGPEGNRDPAPMTVAKARKSQAAHGVSVLEIRRADGRWAVLRESPLARRITGNTPARISGPAAGHALLQSRRFEITPEASIAHGFHDGRSALGTLNNCAHGHTPWGTFLTCEENWNSYFGVRAAEPGATDTPPPDPADIPPHHRRYGLNRNGSGYRWHEVDPRFDLGSNPLEPHLFGWVVEIDPLDPSKPPVKRTALGRFKHESAQPALTPDPSGSHPRLAFYMGDDERNEYLYKFVCHRPFNPANRAANADLLDDGTLYVASFTPQPGHRPGSFRGAWIPLLPDTDSVLDDPKDPGRKRKLRELDLFRSPSGEDRDVLARILIHTRQAGDAVGATMMDRPEWTALRTYFDPDLTPGAVPIYSARRPLEIYCSLTNNDLRGAIAEDPARSFNQPDGSTPAGSARPPVDPANPRPHNLFGHILRWREDGNDVTATGFDLRALWRQRHHPDPRRHRSLACL
ncbi:MAG: PhoX family phosphatase [Verrucomicrobiae bacterium]|nr:PhoX family phosphatase [Verrucomicrobiae bacterium]